MSVSTQNQPDEPPGNTTFLEVQRFDQKWLRAGVGAIPFVVIGALIASGPVQTGSGALNVFLYVLLAMIALGVPTLFALTRLTTTVSPEGIHLHFRPLGSLGGKRDIKWSDIESAKAMEYAPFKQFGGLGLRKARGGTAYSTKGKWGVRVALKSGGIVMIGSQRAQALEDAIMPFLNQTS